LLPVHVRDKRYVNQGKVFVTDAKLELTHRLDEGGRLDVTDRASKLCDIRASIFSARPHRARSIVITNLDDANVRLLTSFVHWNLGDALYPVLDSICHVGNDLKVASERWDHAVDHGPPALFCQDTLPCATRDEVFKSHTALELRHTSFSITSL
jgi:hypothetical protein